MSPLFGLLVLALVAFASSNAFPLIARGSIATTDPTKDSFYKAPSNVKSYHPGQIVRSRAVNTSIPVPVKASYQLLYRTTGTLNEAEVTVATVWQPSKPKSPAQVLSYHYYEDADTLDCNPSWSFVKGTESKNAMLGADEDIFINWALLNGYYVVVPDDEGPKSTFIAGYQEGQAALDGMKAISNFFKFPKKTGFVMTGYSGGAHVTAWAANLAHSYAPDVHILGAVHGGTPIDVLATFKFLDGGPFSGVGLAGLIGLMNAYPTINKYILDHVDASTAALVASYRANNFCSTSTAHPLLNFTALINAKDPFSQPSIKAILNRESLLMSQNPHVAVPTFPRLQTHGLEDEVVPLAPEQEFVKEQCKHGANIQFQVLPVAEHTTSGAESIPGFVAFIQELFDGTTPKVVCGTASPSFVKLTDPEAVKLLGQATVSKLLALVNSVPPGKDLPV